VIDVGRSLEITSDGLIVDGASGFFSGAGVPSFTAPNGSMYLRTDVQEAYQYINSSWKRMPFPKQFIMNLHKIRTINSSFSNGGFWDTWPAQYASGSNSGFGSACYPFTLPFDCKIVEVNMIFRKANFDFNATAGVILHDIELRDHQYNGSTVDSLITVPFGSFSGNNTGDSTHKFTIPAADLVFNSGNNVFEKGLILGARFVKSSGGARAIQSFVDPIMQIILEEI
jgi:hypothetical protein